MNPHLWLRSINYYMVLFVPYVLFIQVYSQSFVLFILYYCQLYDILSCHQALESLNKKDMTEIKSYAKPPTLVEKVMESVMILRGQEPTWSEAKRQLGNEIIDVTARV